MKEILISALGLSGNVIDILAQAFGIVGLVIIVASFQCTKNKTTSISIKYHPLSNVPSENDIICVSNNFA